MFDKIFINSNITNKEIALQYILQFVLVPYGYGGDDFSRIDCSGLVVEFLKALGKIDRNDDYSAAQLYQMFTPVPKPTRGCLVFWENDKKEIVHVAIMLNERLCIEAGGGDSTTLTTDDAIKKNAFVRVRSIYTRKGVAGFSDPFLTISNV